MRNALSPLGRIIVGFIAVFGLVAVALPADAAIDNAVVVPSPNTSPAEDNHLESVSCVSASWCVAVGQFENGDGYNQTLIELWDGSNWTIQASPNPSSTDNNYLESVSCVSESWCVAVGSFEDGGTNQTLILEWDGASWSIQLSPNVSPTETNELYSVSCLSVSFCVAVGDHYNGNFLQTLVQTWDGTNWSIQTSANTSNTETNYLFSVSCLSASSCVAVGAIWRSGWNQPMAQVWDGSSWTMQSIPTFSPTEDNYLEGLSCVSASMCVAVGAHSINGGTVYQTMIQVWDGNTWTIQSSPNPEPTDNNDLESVSCIADWNCVAVGSYRPSSNQTMVLSLTGPAPPTTTTTTPADPVVPAFTG